MYWASRVRKVVIQVVAGRNIAVLVEAAVRNTILQLRGIDTYEKFVERHRQAMKSQQPDLTKQAFFGSLKIPWLKGVLNAGRGFWLFL